MPRPKPKPDPSDLPVTVVALADLTPYPRNPRHITPAAVNAVADSLAAFGWQQPIVIDPKRVIVAGHTRHQAALQIGWTHAPTVTIAAKHARAYRLADNRSGEFSTWDLDVLPGELAALPTGQLEALPALDFDAIVQQPVEGQTDPDDIPEAPEPRTKRGDVWTLGDHRLMCGDSTEADDVARLLDGAKAGLILTDPPYGVGYEYEAWDDSDKEKNDELYVALNSTTRPLVYFCGSVNLSRELNRGRSKVLIWHKPWSMTHSGIGNGRHHWEPVIVRNTSKGAYLETDVIVQNTDRHPGLRKLHSCPKPVQLFMDLIKAFAVEGGAIHDPFVGSGTTIIAAEREHRRCYAMEIAPEYVDVAVARWEAFTGRTATR